MFKRFVLIAVLLGHSGTQAADEPRALTVSGLRLVPPIATIAVFQTQNKVRTEVASAAKFTTPIALPNGGPFEVVVTPKGGIGVTVIAQLTVAAGQTHELKLADVLGTIEVLGDELPRAEKLVVTAADDAGPGEKGHVAVQSAADYRTEMAVPPGTYAVWVVPANGAKARKVDANVRVQAGRNVRVGG